MLLLLLPERGQCVNAGKCLFFLGRESFDPAKMDRLGRDRLWMDRLWMDRLCMDRLWRDRLWALLTIPGSRSKLPGLCHSRDICHRRLFKLTWSFLIPSPLMLV